MVVVRPEGAAAGADLDRSRACSSGRPLVQRMRGGAALPHLVEADVPDHVGDLLVVGVLCGRGRNMVRRLNTFLEFSTNTVYYNLISDDQI